MRRWEAIDPLELSGRSSSFERPMSRRQALRTGALAVGAVAGLSLADAVPAIASRGRQPRPIPGGLAADFSLVPEDPFIHVFPPYYGLEMSTITDFHGVVAAGEVQGEAHGSDGSVRSFDCDMRFMRGRYVALNGQHRDGIFGFI
jgi:hypothetical protein